MTTRLHVDVVGPSVGDGRAANTSAHTSTWASKTWRRDHHDQVMVALPVELGAHERGVARRQDRLRQHQTDPPVPRTDEAAGEGEELRRRVGVRSAAVAARAPARVVVADSCERKGGLPTTRSNRRPVPGRGEGIAVLDPRRHAVAEGGHGAPGRGHGAAVDVHADELDRRAGGHQPAGRGGEEPSVAARRVEHAEATAGDIVRHGVGDDGVDEPLRRRVVAAPLASGIDGLQPGHGASVGSPM